MSYPTSAVPFHGDSVITLDADGTHYVALRPICAALGIDAKNQREKIQSDQRWGDITLPCQTPGGVQEMLCLPLKKLNGWLFSINPNKVRADLKEKVIRYQEECFEVLYQYWQGNTVSRQANAQQTPFDRIDNEKLGRLQSQSKELAWQYLVSLGIERPALESGPGQPRFSHRHQVYDLSELARELKPMAREYDKAHFWVHINELNQILKHQRIPTLEHLLQKRLLMPGELRNDVDNRSRYGRKCNTFISRQFFNGKRKRIYVLKWDLLNQAERGELA